MKTVHVVSLGCAKNLVDTEVMLGSLLESGYGVEDDPRRADVLLVNTCGFIRPAVEEAIDEILDLARLKKREPAPLLVVTGCLVQRYGRHLLRELPEVDLFIGTEGQEHLASLIDEARRKHQPLIHLSTPRSLMDASCSRVLSTPFFRSFLKITEGCDNRCSYCMIPAIRGRLRSRPVADLVQEATRLAQGGVQELTLVGQDLTAYGDDLGPGQDLVALLKTLLQDTTIPWIRMLYLYPTRITDELLDLMASQPRLLPYLDIPFQHVSDRVLKRMRRGYRRKDLEYLLEKIRGVLPECAIRTTLLVGFPGEREADIEELATFLWQYQLDHVGVFPYADEAGSRAFRLDEKVPPPEGRHRFQIIMALQKKIARRRLQRFVGTRQEVLVEGVSRESDLLLEGRTRFQAPDIDGCVYITAGQATPGERLAVQITTAHTYDLVGECCR